MALVRHPWSSEQVAVNLYGDTKEVIALDQGWQRDYWLYQVAHSYGHVETYYAMGIHLQRRNDNAVNEPESR